MFHYQIEIFDYGEPHRVREYRYRAALFKREKNLLIWICQAKGLLEKETLKALFIRYQEILGSNNEQFHWLMKDKRINIVMCKVSVIELELGEFEED